MKANFELEEMKLEVQDMSDSVGCKFLKSLVKLHAHQTTLGGFFVTWSPLCLSKPLCIAVYSKAVNICVGWQCNCRNCFSYIFGVAVCIEVPDGVGGIGNI